MSNLVILNEQQNNLAAIMAYNLNKSVEQVQALVMAEIDNIQAVALVNPDIEQCLPQSIAQAVKSALRQNLSIAPEAGLIYLSTRSLEKNGKWVKVLEAKRTALGEISFQRQCGRLLDLKAPVVEYNENNQVVKVTVEYLVPSHPAPRWEIATFDNAFFRRLMQFSHNERGRKKPDADATKLNYANKLYRSYNGWIDPEFAKAKAIRHALKKLGGNMGELKAHHVQIEPEVLQPEIALVEATEEEVNAEVMVTTKEIINIPNL